MCGHYIVATLPQVMCSHTKSIEEIDLLFWGVGVRGWEEEKESITETLYYIFGDLFLLFLF